MDPRDLDLAPQLDFIPLEEELELLFSRVHATRFAGA